jgi:hypothetical protein
MSELSSPPITLAVLAPGDEVTLHDPVEGLDSSGMEFGFNALVEYECAKAKEFSLDENTTFLTMEYRCQWDNEWDQTTLPDCACEYFA